MTDIEQYAQRYAERIESALVGACPRAVIEAESLATARYATRLATRACEMAGGAPVQPDSPLMHEDALRPNHEIYDACRAASADKVRRVVGNSEVSE